MKKQSYSDSTEFQKNKDGFKMISSTLFRNLTFEEPPSLFCLLH